MRDPAEAGQSTVEVALALPLLLMALVGAVQFALVHHARAVTTSATVEGARAAAVEGGSPLLGAERTRGLLAAGLGRTGEAFVVTLEDRGETVASSAMGTYPLFIPWVQRLDYPIRAVAEVRKEGFRRGP